VPTPTASGASSETASATSAVENPFDRIAAGDPNLSLDVSFPPRNEPFDFRQRLEAKYRDGLRRGATSSFVDIEGDIVWIQEYLRYRVNACSHDEALQRVLSQIDTGVIASVCGTSQSGTIAFPPRNEPFAFRQALEAKYRDGLRRGAGQTFVDVEGDIVWVTEYLRYRVNACSHLEAVDKVFMQIDGRGIQPVCTPVAPSPPLPPPTSPTPTPDPTCGPRSAPCGPATAVCRDGTLSCSQNRSGTCSSHGGVACWICPGRLCSGIEAATLSDFFGVAVTTSCG
jgi:hypothetical protein